MYIFITKVKTMTFFFFKQFKLILLFHKTWSCIPISNKLLI